MSASINEAIRPAIELPSTDLSHHPSIFRATSSAVKSSPLFHLTPLRTFSVYFVASLFADQLSSKFGVIDPSLLYSTKYSSVPAVKCASCVQSKTRGSFSAIHSIAMRIVPPCCKCPPATAGDEAPISPYAPAAVTPNAVALAINSLLSISPSRCSLAYIWATGWISPLPFLCVIFVSLL